MKSEAVTAKVRPVIVEQLRKLAAADDRTVSRYVARLIEEHVAKSGTKKRGK